MSSISLIHHYAEAEHYLDLFSDFAMPKHEREVNRNKISAHHAKAGYDCPTIRLPHTLSVLAGLPTKIYQTVHDGTLAFLVVIAPKEKTAEIAKPGLTVDNFS